MELKIKRQANMKYEEHICDYKAQNEQVQKIYISTRGGLSSKTKLMGP